MISFHLRTYTGIPLCETALNTPANLTFHLSVLLFCLTSKIRSMGRHYVTSGIGMSQCITMEKYMPRYDLYFRNLYRYNCSYAAVNIDQSALNEKSLRLDRVSGRVRRDRRRKCAQRSIFIATKKKWFSGCYENRGFYVFFLISWNIDVHASGWRY